MQRAGRGEREKVCDYGKYGEETIKKELAKTEARRKEAAEFVQGRLAENNKKFLAEIDKQVLLDGDQISLGDMELLRSELVANENELKALQVRHASSPAMRRAIAKYAKNKNWPGFDDATNASNLRAFADRFFRMCGYAPGTRTAILRRLRSRRALCTICWRSLA